MRPFKFIVKLAILLLPSASLYAQPLDLKPDTPDRYVVRPGDTLWGIAGRFTDSPQQWTAIWQLNKEQIKNPNVLRPGEVILLESARSHAGETATGGVAPDRPTPSPPPGDSAKNGGPGGVTPDKPPPTAPSTSGSGSATGGATSGGSSSGGTIVTPPPPRPSPGIEPTTPWPRPPRRE